MSLNNPLYISVKKLSIHYILIHKLLDLLCLIIKRAYVHKNKTEKARFGGPGGGKKLEITLSRNNIIVE
jgi:hypothetical protein